MQATLRLKLLILSLTAPLAAQAAPLYTIMAPAGAIGLSPQAMNNVGQIVAYTQSLHAAMADASGTTSLHPAGAGSSLAFGINDAGAASGQVSKSGLTRATVFAGGTTTDLGALGGANGSSFGTGINTSGQVTGASYLVGSAGNYHAFLYGAGAMADIGTLGGDVSYGYGINDSGAVVGYSQVTPNGETHAFRYAGGGMTDLGTLGGTYSSATAINAPGATVGFSYLAGDAAVHPFLSTGGGMADLGSLGGDSYAFDINDAGQVVGNYAVGGSTNAFLWTSGLMQDLNALIDPASGWHLTFAAAINEHGQIAAEGCRGGTCQALLLSLAAPVVPDPTNVPEPASFAAVAAALGLVGLIRRHKQGGRR